MQPINTCMKISEISHPLQTFIATVRVVLPHTCITARTIALADNFMSAKSILAKTYGANNVMSVSQITQECVIDEATKTLSAAELQVKSMSDRAKQLNQQAKQVKARNKLQTAQTNLLKASSPLRTN